MAFKMTRGAAMSAAAMLGVSMFALEAAAQQGEERAGTLEDEIIVSAQRREQNVRDVPVSITVIGEEAIQDYQIDELSDYVTLAPNVGSVDLGNPLQLNLVIRGVRNIGGAVNSVGVYVDDFNLSPTANTDAYDSNLFDIERIEVLRGPQSTAFGRNVSGGAVSITSKKPDANRSGYFEAEYGRFNSYEFRGGANLPITDELFFRGVAYYEASDSFIENIGTGDDAARENLGGRGALRYQPNDALTVDLALSYSYFEQGYPEAVPTGLFDIFLNEFVTGLFGVSPDPNGTYDEIGFAPENTNQINTNGRAELSRELLVATGKVEYDFGPVVGILNGGYMQQEVVQAGDFDFLPEDWFEDDTSSNVDSYSIEARLQADDAESLYWSLGLLYAQDESSGSTLRLFQNDFFAALPFFTGNPFPFEPAVADFDTRDEIESFAVFGDFAWTVLDERLTIEGGVRYAIDEVFSFVDFGNQFNPVGLTFSDPDPRSGSETFNTISARAAARYALTDGMNVYVQAARGAKPGGFNLGALDTPGLPTTYAPEALWNYEAGVKAVALDGALVFNFAAFYMDWTDIQFNSGFTLPGTTATTTVTQNAGEAEAYGAEFDFAAQITDKFRINGGLGYLDGQFTGGRCDLPDVDFEVCGIDGLGDPVDILGNELPNMSTITANFAAQYTTPVFADFDGFVRGEFGWVGDYFQGTFNTSDPTDPLFNFINGFETVNIRLGVENDRFRIVAFGENITNDGVVVGTGATGVASSGAGQVFAIRPAYYGGRLTVKFGQ